MNYIGHRIVGLNGVYVHAVFGGTRKERRIYVEAYTDDSQSQPWQAAKELLIAAAIFPPLEPDPAISGKADRLRRFVGGPRTVEQVEAQQIVIMAEIAALYKQVLNALEPAP